jgi:hypothetical protein
VGTEIPKSSQADHILHEENPPIGLALRLRQSDTLLAPWEVLAARYALAIAVTVVLMLLGYMGWRVNRILTIYAQEMMYRRISTVWLRRQHLPDRISEDTRAHTSAP